MGEKKLKYTVILSKRYTYAHELEDDTPERPLLYCAMVEADNAFQAMKLARTEAMYAQPTHNRSGGIKAWAVEYYFEGHHKPYLLD